MAKKDVPIQFLAEKHLYEALRKQAYEERRSQSDICREALRKHLGLEEEKPR